MRWHRMDVWCHTALLHDALLSGGLKALCCQRVDVSLHSNVDSRVLLPLFSFFRIYIPSCHKLAM